MEVAGVHASAGEKVERLVTVAIAGREISLPLFVIRGERDGPTLVVTAGVHGAEYASVEAALRLGRQLEPAQMRGTLVVLPVTNMPAFRARTAYVGPYDGKNLNRVFPGCEGGTFSEALAHWVLREVISRADYYVDLHGGDLVEALVPFVIYAPTGNEEVDRGSRLLAEHFGVGFVVQDAKPGTAIHAASRAGIPAILGEAGGQGIWDEQSIATHINGVTQIMRCLRMTQGEPHRAPGQLVRFPWLFSDHDGLFYPRVRVGETVSAGQQVGSVCDYFGNELQRAVAPSDGTVLFLLTALAVRAGDPLMGLGEGVGQ